MTKAGLTIEGATARMHAALATLRRGETPEARAEAVQALDAAIADAARLPAGTWQDAQHKASMVRVTLAGRNASAARRVVASLARDLENLPAKGSAEH